MHDPAKPTVFVSYAHENDEAFQAIMAHLRPLARDAQIDVWADTRINSSDLWREEIDDALDRSTAAVLLVSVAFIGSDFIHGVELPKIQEAQKQRGLRVFWILLSPCDLTDHAEVTKFQAVHPTDKPWSMLNEHERHEVGAKLSRDIRALLPRKGSGLPPPGPQLVHLPARNSRFTGRDDVLAILHINLTAHRRAALHGIPGVGKTQTAVEYAHRHVRDYSHIFWLNADTPETLTSHFADVAAALGLPEAKEPEIQRAVDAARRWLDAHEGWLLILDNADDLAAVEPLIPADPTGRLLLTTREPTAPALAADPIATPVDPMPDDDGARLLLRRAGLLRPHAPLDSAIPEHLQAARCLSRDLGGLPLALDQAGAYIQEYQISLTEYATLFAARKRALLARRGRLGGNDHIDVAATFQLAFDKLRIAHPAAADLIAFCAFLAPEPIPEFILTEGASHLGEPLATVLADPLTFNDTLHAATRTALVRRDREDRTLEMHRLVQAVVREQPEFDEARWAERALLAVEAAFPPPEFRNWPTCDAVLPHALAVVSLVTDTSPAGAVAARLMNDAACYMKERGQASEAEPLCLRTLQIRERVLGAEHPDTASSLNNLAALYKSQGRHAEALPLCLRALKIRERELGADHPNTATSLDNLAGIYGSLGRHAEALPLCLRALKIRERELGADHPNTAASLNNLAGIYGSLGRHAEALPLYLRALETCERKLGPDHPNTATSLNNLALLYVSQGRHAEAEPLVARAVSIAERVLGPEHPNTQIFRTNLASLQARMGRPADYEPSDA